MSEENNNNQPQAPADAAPAHETPAPAADATSQEQPFLNKSEAVKYFKQTRELSGVVETLQQQQSEILAHLRGLGEKQPPKEPAKQVEKPSSDVDAAAMVGQLRSELAFNESLAELDRPLSRAQKAHLKRMYALERPRDPEEWLSETVSELWPEQPKNTTQVQPPPPQPEAKPKTPSVDTGAPGVDPRNALPTNIMNVDPTVWKTLSPEEKMERYKAHKRARGFGGNPLAERRLTNRSGN